jgi:Type IV secretion system pilin
MKNKVKLGNILFTIILTVAFVSPFLVLAQGGGQIPLPTGGGGQVPPCLTSGKICNPIKTGTINEVIKVILQGIIKVGIPVIALAIIYCGFLFVSAQGKPESIKKAKDALMYTLIGAAILLGSWAIAQLISETVLAL